MAAKKDLIRLHGNASFDRGGKVRWLLTEMGLKYEDRWLDHSKNEHESPAYLKLNPMGRVPVVEIGEHVMFESGAICAYLADLYLDQSMAPALSAPERAEYQKWMYFASATVDALQGKIEFIEEIPPSKEQRAKEESLQEELRDALTSLDQALSKSSFLAGNRFSAADICVSYQLFWLRLWPEQDPALDVFPRVKAYLDRMVTRPAAVSAGTFAYPG